MKIKFLGTIIALFAIPFVLTGCIFANLTVDINANGSGSAKLVGGYSKEILNKLGKTPKDFSSQNNEYYEFVSGGKHYLGETWEDKFPAYDIISSSGVSSIYGVLGPVELVRLNNGMQLNLGLWDFISKDMTYEHKFPEFNDISDETLQGMKLVDLIAQDVDGLVLNATFNMPYEVKQIKGSTEGVIVKGKKISLDYLKMIESGSREWKFESIDPNADPNESFFSDIKKEAWYYEPVEAVVKVGILNGYSNGTFKPNNSLTLAELSKIIVACLGYDIPNNPKYWATGHVLFAQENGFVLSKAEVTAKNWDVPATREQVVYAITLATGLQGATGNVKSQDIKGWSNIDPVMQSTILAAYNAGIVKGTPNGSFNAKGKITRAEMAQILYNIMDRA
ncbi:MAG: S-layer homology domain-containing protein [Paenibacillaceae bacterium]